MADINPKEARKHEILEAAFQAFAEKGYDKTSVDDIVRVSGLSKGTLYWYFESKQAIFVALVTHVFDAFSEVFKQFVTETEDLPPDKQLQMLINSSSQMMDAVPEFSGLYIDFFVQAWQYEAVQETLVRVYNQYVEMLRKILRRGIDEGVFRPVNIEATACAIAGAVDGIWFQRILNINQDDEPMYALADIILHGVVKGKHNV